MAEQFLCAFCEKVYLPHVFRSEAPITVINILSCPPRHSVSANCLFWEKLALFVIYQLRPWPLYIEKEVKVYVSTACRNLQNVEKMYHCLTHQQIDLIVLAEAQLVVGEESLCKAKPSL